MVLLVLRHRRLQVEDVEQRARLLVGKDAAHRMRVADVHVPVEEAGGDHEMAPVDDAGGARVGQLGRLAHPGDAAALHQDGAVLDDAALAIDGQDVPRVIDLETLCHGAPPPGTGMMSRPESTSAGGPCPSDAPPRWSDVMDAMVGRHDARAYGPRARGGGHLGPRLRRHPMGARRLLAAPAHRAALPHRGRARARAGAPARALAHPRSDRPHAVHGPVPPAVLRDRLGHAARPRRDRGPDPGALHDPLRRAGPGRAPRPPRVDRHRARVRRPRADRAHRRSRPDRGGPRADRALRGELGRRQRARQAAAAGGHAAAHGVAERDPAAAVARAVPRARRPARARRRPRGQLVARPRRRALPGPGRHRARVRDLGRPAAPLPRRDRRAVRAPDPVRRGLRFLARVRRAVRPAPSRGHGARPARTRGDRGADRRDGPGPSHSGDTG